MQKKALVFLLLAWLLCSGASSIGDTDSGGRGGFNRTFWIIGDSHVFKGSGLQVGLCDLMEENGDRCVVDSTVGARVQDWVSEGEMLTDRHRIAPDDVVIVSLGMNSSMGPLKTQQEDVKKFVYGMGGRTCYWIFPPISAKGESPGYWKMMEKAVSPCGVFDSRKRMKIKRGSIMGKFHLKIGYARRVWAPLVWDFVNGGYFKERYEEYSQQN